MRLTSVRSVPAFHAGLWMFNPIRGYFFRGIPRVSRGAVSEVLELLWMFSPVRGGFFRGCPRVKRRAVGEVLELLWMFSPVWGGFFRGCPRVKRGVQKSLYGCGTL
jgi:hypothetical protein